MKHCAHLWGRMTPELQHEILQIPFRAVEDGLREAKTTEARHTTELVGKEHRKLHAECRHQADDLDVFVSS